MLDDIPTVVCDDVVLKNSVVSFVVVLLFNDVVCCVIVRCVIYSVALVSVYVTCSDNVDTINFMICS